jgi:SAM-dependent methyltransferase
MSIEVDYERLWGNEWAELQRIGPLTRSLQRLVLKTLKPNLFDDALLLDVGCGNGNLLAALMSRFPGIKATGIEGSRRAIASMPGPVRSCVVRRDISGGFSMDDSVFDVITCCEVLEHLEDYRPALSSIAHHLKDSGVCLITVPHSMRYWSKSDEFSGHHRRFDYADFYQELRLSGLEPLKYFTWGFPVSYLYNKVVGKIEPARLMRPARSPLKMFAAKLVYRAMMFDDLFVGKRWHQLIALCKKAPEA